MNILDNVDFIIPVYIDHPDRIRNLNIALKYLNKLGTENIIVNEHYRNASQLNGIINMDISFISKDIRDDEYYNKMQCANDAFNNLSKGKIVCLYDVDVLPFKKDLIDATEKLLDGYDFAYPFDGKFYDMPIEIVDQLNTNLDAPIDMSKCKLFASQSHGGCVMFKRESFISGGKFNPNFKNVGFDDDEINVRFTRLNYKKYRTKSPLLHMTHYRGATSYNFNKYNDHNGKEVAKITNMDINELKKYIRNW